MNWTRNVNWAGLLFGLVGLIFVGFTMWFAADEKIASATATFGFAIFSFIFAHLSRFKSIKGLGFEAELWEDKQKEAAELIDRLKDVVAIYTSEIVMAKVKANRFADGKRWKEVVPLYDRLVEQHNVLGQRIDFADLKRDMDGYFLLDCCYSAMRPMDLAIGAATTKAREIITKEFGTRIEDPEGYRKRLDQLSFPTRIEDPHEVSLRENLATRMLSMAEDARVRLKRDFDVDVEFPDGLLDRLQRIAALYNSRPVRFTPEIIALADRH